MAYGVKYRCSYLDRVGKPVQLDILLRDYSGEIIPVVGGPEPVTYQYEASNDEIHTFLKPTALKIQLFSTDKDTFSEFDIVENFQYLVKLYWDETQILTTWINDEIFVQPYLSGKFLVTLTASDGLSILKGRYTELTGRCSHMDMVLEALNALKLDINVVDAINVIEAGHTTGIGPLSQTYFDTDIFTAEKGKRWELVKVLEDVLDVYNAFIVQVNNKWIIANVESFYDSFVGVEYTSTGSRVGAWVYDREKTIGIDYKDNNIALLTDGNIQKEKPWRELSVKLNYGKIDDYNYVKNGDFSIRDTHPTRPESFLVHGWEYNGEPMDGHPPFWEDEYDPYLKQKGDYYYLHMPVHEDEYFVKTKEVPTNLFPQSDEEHIFSFKYAVIAKLGLTYFSGKQDVKVQFKVTNSEGSYYLSSDGTWGTSAVDILISEVVVQMQTGFSWFDFSLITDGFPGGYIEVTCRCLPQGPSSTEDYTATAYVDFRFNSVNVEERSAVTILRAVNDLNHTTIPDEKEFTQTELATQDETVGYKNYLSLADGTITNSWTSSHFTGRLVEIWVKNMLNRHGRALFLKTASVMGMLNPLDIIVDENERRFQIKNYQFTFKDYKASQVGFIEILPWNTITPLITEEQFISDSDTGSTGGSTGGGTEGGGSIPIDEKVAQYNIENKRVVAPPGYLLDKIFDYEMTTDHVIFFPVGAGYGLVDAYNDYQEVLVGCFPKVSTGQEKLEEGTTPWVLGDRLFAIGNGTGNESRNNAYVMYKSGFSKLDNALGLGKYEHSDIPPEDGYFQYDVLPQVFHSENWINLIISLADGSATELTLDPVLQELSLDLSAYAKMSWVTANFDKYENWLLEVDGFIAQTVNSGNTVNFASGTNIELSYLNGTLTITDTLAASLHPVAFSGDYNDLINTPTFIDTFIELTDTPAAYPVVDRGQLVRQSSENTVGFAGKIGQDVNGVWIGTDSSFGETEIPINSDLTYDIISGEDYKFVVVVTGMTEGEVGVYKDGDLLGTIIDNGTYTYHFEGGSNIVVDLYVEDSSNFDGIVGQQLFQLIWEEGSGLKFVDNEFNVIGFYKQWIDSEEKNIFSLSDLIRGNITDSTVSIPGQLILTKNDDEDTAESHICLKSPGRDYYWGIGSANWDEGKNILNFIYSNDYIPWMRFVPSGEEWTEDTIEFRRAMELYNFSNYIEFGGGGGNKIKLKRDGFTNLGFSYYPSPEVEKPILHFVDNQIRIYDEPLMLRTIEGNEYNKPLRITFTVDDIVQAATAGHVPTIIDTAGVKSIEWAAAQPQIPGTETLSGTSVTVNWNGKTAASLTLTGATTITFGTPANYVKRLFVSGDYLLTLPAAAEVLSGEYDGTKTNIIDLIPAPNGTVYVTIN